MGVGMFLVVWRACEEWNKMNKILNLKKRPRNADWTSQMISKVFVWDESLGNSWRFFFLSCFFLHLHGSGCPYITLHFTVQAYVYICTNSRTGLIQVCCKNNNAREKKEKRDYICLPIFCLWLTGTEGQTD